MRSRTNSTCLAGLIAFICLFLAVTATQAASILFYDSDGTTNLSLITSKTNEEFIASSNTSTSLGSATTYFGDNGNSLTVTLGSGNDRHYAFGSGMLNGSLENSVNNGLWIGTTFVADQDLTVDQLSLLVYTNSLNGSNYGARDVGAFIRIGNSDAFTQFGSPFDFSTQGILRNLTFIDTFHALQGESVEIRFAFTDRTSISTTTFQGTTRVGSINISAVPAINLTVTNTPPDFGPVSHPTSTSFTTSFGANSSNPYFGRGQTFTTTDTGDAYTQWSVSKLAIQAKQNQTFGNGDAIRLWVVKWNPDNDANDMTTWNTGDGLSDGNPLDSTGGMNFSVVLVDGSTYTLPTSISNGNYLHFEFESPLLMDEDTAYAAFFEFVDADDGTVGDNFIRISVGAGGNTYSNGRSLRTTESANGSFDQDLTLFIEGTKTSPLPSSGLAMGSPFQDGMIFQRDKPVAIWGQALPSTEVTVTMNGINVTGVSDAIGKWEIEWPAQSSGGPYSMAVTSGGEVITLTDVLFGDVWFAFGQSNMVRTLNEMDDRQAIIDDITNNDLPIRCLKVTQQAATSEQEEGPITWLDNSNPSSWTSVGAVFAYKMYQHTGVPTAIIWAAWGSTSIEGWMPLEMTEQFPHFASEMADYYTNDEATVTAMLNGTQSYNDVYIRTRPNIVYNQMVHPLLRYGISGFVWYQGEANATDIDDAAQYGYTLPGFVTEYRERFNQGDLPFLGVQLPSHNRTNWPWFRESQDQLETLVNAHIAVTIDTGSASNIHPTDKEPIGTRLSLLARKYVYGDTVEAHGPRFDSMSINNNTVTISFTNASGLTTDDMLAPSNFQLAGSNQVFHNATSASINGIDVILRSTSVNTPVAVRYAWSPAPVASLNLVNSDDLPAVPFRTDTWALPSLGAQKPQSVNDNYQTIEDQILSIPADGVLTNDIDLNGDTLTAAIISTTSNGSLSLLSDGSFSYTPTSGFIGTDSFVYKCSDGSLDSPNATVTINVSAPSTGYSPWQSTINWEAGDNQTPTGDPDLDGVINFLEFAFDLNPLVASQIGMPALTSNGNDFDFDFNNAQAGITYSVQLSTDLITWSAPAFAVLTNNSVTPVVIPSSEGSNGKLFIRLSVNE